MEHTEGAAVVEAAAEADEESCAKATAARVETRAKVRILKIVVVCWD